MKRTMKDMLLHLKAWMEDLLFPEDVSCLCCGCAPQEELSGGLCEACHRALAAKSLADGESASACPKELAFVHAAFSYEDPAKRLIWALKYERIRQATLPLIEAMVMLPSGEEELIVPVPTTARRLRERGFNQSLLLAQGIGKRLGMEVCDALVRIGEQREQASLRGKARRTNLEGCMRAKMRLDGKRILLVDDVYTTGTTAKEAARALYEAGAASVGVFVAARADGSQDDPPFLSFGR